MHSHRRVPLLLVMLLLGALLVLAGCQRTEEAAETPQAPNATSPATTEATHPIHNPNQDPVPETIQVRTTLQPAIDPVCLEPHDGFVLLSGPIPEEGLEPGMVHVFCAVGAPEGETVTFRLQAPDGTTQTFQAVSVDQGGIAVAVQPITIGADAAPGEWTLTAQYGDTSGSMRFQVRPASGPYLVLAEPVPDNPSIIKVAVGGLVPNAQVYFAVYRLQPGATEGNVAISQGELLIDHLIQVDEAGRADVQLDVADQPEGPYLLALFSPDVSGEPMAVINLPEQERTALALNIYRAGSPTAATPGQPPAQSVAEQPTQPALDQTTLPPAPQPVEGSGGLPDALTVTLPDASLPQCVPTQRPSLRLWPAIGEVGQWWYGCAAGFAPNAPLRVDATLPNGSTSSFDLTASDAQGINAFRWYAPPSEGTGPITITVSDMQGHQAQASWRIAAATHPHALVYPHAVVKEVGAELYLTGFPARGNVRLGIYQLDEMGQGRLVKTFSLQVNKKGAWQKAFAEAMALEPGIYALLAQSAPTYQFSGIDVPASAVEFFSVAAPLPEKYEFYTLFVDRSVGGVVAVGEEPQEAQGTETPSTPASGETIPSTLTLAVDNSAAPTCPDAPAGKPAICLMPTTIERATYTYMLMHGFDPGTKFAITVTTPKGNKVKFSVQADDNGFADAHWYALNDERLGVYRVAIRGGGKKFTGSFKVIKAASPHVVVQPRTPEPGTPVIISISGLEPNSTYTLARYRSSGESGGQVTFQLEDTMTMKTGKGGGAQVTVPTGAEDQGTLFLAALFDAQGGQPLAQEVYAPGQELYLRYPFAWGGSH